MNVLALYLLFVIGGVVIEGITAKIYFSLTKKQLHKSRFTYGRYLFLLTFPILGTMLVIHLQGWSLLKVFLIFLLVGPLFEWLVGYSYYEIVGTRLWTYHRLTYKGHASFLSAPMWGMAGILFYLIAQRFV